MEKPKSFHIYINENSGTVQNLGGNALEELLVSSGLDINGLYIMPAEKLFEKIKQETGQYSILIGGGDGTLNASASILGKKNIPFGILPLGTMNLLAKDLNIDVNLSNAVEAYTRGAKEISIDVTYANNNLFLCSAGIGTIPASSNFRENNRSQSQALLMPRLTWFILDRLDSKRRKSYKIKLEDKEIKLKSASLVISNNQYAQSEEWSEPSLKRQSLQDGQMILYSAAPSNFWDKCRILFKLGLGGWRQDPKIKEWSAKEIILQCDDDKEQVSLDGETFDLSTPIHFTMKPKSLKLLIPQEAYDG